MAAPDSNPNIEFSSVSGVVYVSIDQKIYTQRFMEDVKVWIVIDSHPSHQNVLVGDSAEDFHEKQSGCFTGVDNSLSIHFENQSSDVGNEGQNASAALEYKSSYNISQFNFVEETELEDEATENYSRNKYSYRSAKGKKKKVKGLMATLNSGLSVTGKDCEVKAALTNQSDGTRACTDSHQEHTESKTNVCCKYCSKNFENQKDFYNHRKSIKTQQYKCDTCGKVFPFKAHLIVHGYTMHRDDTDASLGDSSRQEESSSSMPSNPKELSSYKCEVCNVAKSSTSTLKTHMMLHTGEFAYKCCVCSKHFNSIGHFSHHMTSHTRSGNVRCKICDIDFDSRSELSRHQLSHDFKCHICGVVFPNRTSRAFHYKNQHKDNILKCSLCHKLFSSSTELQLHQKYHQNRSKTQCTICGRFVSRLSDHILSHSSIPDQVHVYVCDKCPKQFKQKLCFQRHMRTHSEEKHYACMYCPKRFLRSGGLSRHMLVHTQEKPFVCPVCGKSCTQMANLKSHMRQVHHQGWDHPCCGVCGAVFTNQMDLQDHLRDGHDGLDRDTTQNFNTILDGTVT